LVRLAVLFVSFDSATTFVWSTVATFVPTRQGTVNVAVAPGASAGTVKVPTKEVPTTILRMETPAAAFPPFLTMIEFFGNDATYRSGRGGGGGGGGATIDQLNIAGCPTLPAASCARTANECVPTLSDWYEAGLKQAA